MVKHPLRRKKRDRGRITVINFSIRRLAVPKNFTLSRSNACKAEGVFTNRQGGIFTARRLVEVSDLNRGNATLRPARRTPAQPAGGSDNRGDSLKTVGTNRQAPERDVLWRGVPALGAAPFHRRGICVRLPFRSKQASSRRRLDGGAQLSAHRSAEIGLTAWERPSECKPTIWLWRSSLDTWPVSAC